MKLKIGNVRRYRGEKLSQGSYWIVLAKEEEGSIKRSWNERIDNSEFVNDLSVKIL